MEKDYEGSHQETNAQNESRESEQLHIRGVRHLGVDSHTGWHVQVLFNAHAHGRIVALRARTHTRSYVHEEDVREGGL